ncbi:10352_t:CDS:1, partial [Racocetra fulgida]
AKPSIKILKIDIMNQPANQAVGGQPLVPQNVTSSFDDLTAKQKYEILAKGANPFPSNAGAQEIENQTLPD